MIQKLIRNLQCCFPGHKQFPGNQSAQVPSQHCIGGRGGGGEQRLMVMVTLFRHGKSFSNDIKKDKRLTNYT